MADEIVWTTKDGDELTMKEITNSHLCNIVRLLRRKSLAHLSDGYGFMSMLQGEMAIDAAESQIDLEQGVYLEAIDLFEAEAKRRHITIPAGG